MSDGKDEFPQHLICGTERDHRFAGLLQRVRDGEDASSVIASVQGDGIALSHNARDRLNAEVLRLDDDIRRVMAHLTIEELDALSSGPSKESRVADALKRKKFAEEHVDFRRSVKILEDLKVNATDWQVEVIERRIKELVAATQAKKERAERQQLRIREKNGELRSRTSWRKVGRSVLSDALPQGYLHSAWQERYPVYSIEQTVPCARRTAQSDQAGDEMPVS